MNKTKAPSEWLGREGCPNSDSEEQTLLIGTLITLAGSIELEVVAPASPRFAGN